MKRITKRQYQKVCREHNARRSKLLEAMDLINDALGLDSSEWDVVYFKWKDLQNKHNKWRESTEIIK